MKKLRYSFDKTLYVTGESIIDLLQLLARDRQTCIINVRSEGRLKGTMYIDEGEFHTAFCGELKGESAAFQMIFWKTVTIEVLPSPDALPEKTFKGGLKKFLQQVRFIQERRSSWNRLKARQAGKNKVKTVKVQHDNNIELPIENLIKGGTQMAGLKQMMKDIADEMDGVISVGIVGMDGITIAVHNPTGMDMDVVSAKFAMVMKLVEKSVEDLSGLGEFEENLVQTGNAWILTRYLDQQYYLACIVSREGTLGNVRLVAKKNMEQIRRAL